MQVTVIMPSEGAVKPHTSMSVWLKPPPSKMATSPQLTAGASENASAIAAVPFGSDSDTVQAPTWIVVEVVELLDEELLDEELLDEELLDEELEDELLDEELLDEELLDDELELLEAPEVLVEEPGGGWCPPGKPQPRSAAARRPTVKTMRVRVARDTCIPRMIPTLSGRTSPRGCPR